MLDRLSDILCIWEPVVTPSGRQYDKSATFTHY
jgi:hypothetical protein